MMHPTPAYALMRSVSRNSSCEGYIHYTLHLYASTCNKRLYSTHSDLDDLKRTADCSTQFDAALTSAIKREREVTVKTEAMRAHHKNLGEGI